VETKQIWVGHNFEYIQVDRMLEHLIVRELGVDNIVGAKPSKSMSAESAGSPGMRNCNYCILKW